MRTRATVETGALRIRAAASRDTFAIRSAVIELQEYERRLHWSRPPGEAIADGYLAWLQQQAAARDGAILVAEIDRKFAGFVAGWVEQNEWIAETPDSNRFGFVSDICVMPPYRGRRIAERMLAAIETHLAAAGITVMRLGVLAANLPAQAAYGRAGFAPYEIVYEKRIDKANVKPA